MAEIIQKKNTSSRDRMDRRGGPRRGGQRNKPEVKELEQKIVDLARVTRVTAGGKRMTFRAALAVGDKKGRVGFAVAKGADVQLAVEKAYTQAKKKLIRVPMRYQTIPHPVQVKFGSAEILLKPAPAGTGLKAGGAVRMLLELAGVPNVVARILNSSNKINIARATLGAIAQLADIPEKTEKKKEVVTEKKEETVS